MYYALNEEQARAIASSFRHLIGLPFAGIDPPGFTIERVIPTPLEDGTWKVELQTYPGDKKMSNGEYYGHTELKSDLWIYLMKTGTPFDPAEFRLTDPHQ